MKKKLQYIIISSLVAGNLFAQIPNADFESWTSEGPDSWTVILNGEENPPIQSTTVHGGTSALKFKMGGIFLGAINDFLVAGNNGNGFVISYKPQTLHGWYIFNSDGGDVLKISSKVATAGTAGPFYATTSNSVYKEFVLVYNYSTQDMGADTCKIEITFDSQTSGTGIFHSGTYVIIDDLSFGGSEGINDKSVDFSLEKIYPNPTKSSINIIYTLKNRSNVELFLYDIHGRKIKHILTANQNEGRYKAVLSADELTQGIYFCGLLVNGVESKMKLVVE